MKCDCGDNPHSKDNCAESDRGKSGNAAKSIKLSSDPSVTDGHVCCCSHGARCTCALKKDPALGTVPETDTSGSSPPLSFSSRKPRLPQTHSDNALTVFTNGHHKPVHKQNHSAHQSGLPYKIPIPHSVRGNADVAPKHSSTDNLPLSLGGEVGPSPLQDSFFSAQQNLRRTRSEHGSPEPKIDPDFDFNNPLQPLDLTYPSLNDATSNPGFGDLSYPSPQGMGSYLTPQDDHPIFSPGIEMPSVDDWSAIDLPLENNGLPLDGDGDVSTSYSQPPSYASFNYNSIGPPGLTASSSGELSDFGDESTSQCQSAFPSDPNIPAGPTSGEPGFFQSGTSAAFQALQQPSPLPEDHQSDSPGSFQNMSHPSPPASQTDNLDMDQYIQTTTASPSELENPTVSKPLGLENMASHHCTVKDAQKLAHQSHQTPPTEAMGDLSLPTPKSEGVDPPWAASFSEEGASFDLENCSEASWER